MEQWIPMIGEVGFPIVLSIYLLIRIEGKLEILTNSITDLTHTITRIK